MENKKIVLIDDDEDLREVFGMGLRQAGFQVEEAADGKEGLAKVKEFSPALVLMDVVMPKMDGYEALEEMKKDPEIKNIPVVMLTNLSNDTDRAEALRLQAHEYIVKASVTPSELARRIQLYLNDIEEPKKNVKII